MSSIGQVVGPNTAGFRHAAFLYANSAEFLAGTSAFINDGLAHSAPIMVAVDAAKIDLLRRRLGPDAADVDFVDMREIGRNPATIIPVWQDFIDACAGTKERPRGIGEPAWPERSAAEQAECREHEALLNVAFDDGPGWDLLCPYDRTLLDEVVLEHALETHPVVGNGRSVEGNASYRAASASMLGGDDALPALSSKYAELHFDRGSVATVRRLAATQIEASGWSAERIQAFVLAVNEVAANSVVHGGGRGTMRMWTDHASVICEITDAGQITDRLVGRRRPRVSQERGRGLWLANHLCDLVQIRSSGAGTAVRLHLRDR